MSTFGTRRLRAVSATVLLGGALVGLAGFGWGHRHSEKFFKRMVDAHIEEVLDKLAATPAQRQQVSAIEDNLLADLKATRETHRAAFKQIVDEFAQDQLDSSSLDQLATSNEQSLQKLRQDIRQAILDVHGLLTSAQRQQLVQIIKSHHHQAFGDEGAAGQNP